MGEEVLTGARGAEEGRVRADADDGVAGDGAVDDDDLGVVARGSGDEGVEGGHTGDGAADAASGAGLGV